jgi:hypothetical protein
MVNWYLLHLASAAEILFYPITGTSLCKTSVVLGAPADPANPEFTRMVWTSMLHFKFEHRIVKLSHILFSFLISGVSSRLPGWNYSM